MPNKLSQQLKQEQGFALSPVQLLTSKLVELTGIELEQRIERELEENPALEEGVDTNQGEIITSDELESKDNEQDWELGEYASEDDIPSYKLRELQERQTQREEIPFSSTSPSLDTLLLDQLRIEGLSEREEYLARYIIGNINEEGYLKRSTWELQDDLLFKEGLDINPEEIDAMVQRIKTLEPAGIAAKDLQECLILQLERQPQTPRQNLSLNLLRNHYNDFVSKRFDHLTEALNINREQLADLYHNISRLDPKPGIGVETDYDDKLGHYTPDFVVWVDESEALQLTLIGERDIRPLRLSPTYQDMLLDKGLNTNERKKRETLDFVKHKLEQARFFIDALSQRQATLKKTMLAIIEHQKAFFISGDIADLRPMVLKDIADVTGLDISTISRVSNSKSVQTNHGIYPIKYFFGDGITSDNGEEVSTKVIKQTLLDLIESEDKDNPLTDEQLADSLSALGYTLARRTIAKYREALKIPVARLRRTL